MLGQARRIGKSKFVCRGAASGNVHVSSGGRLDQRPIACINKPFVRVIQSDPSRSQSGDGLDRKATRSRHSDTQQSDPVQRARIGPTVRLAAWRRTSPVACPEGSRDGVRRERAPRFIGRPRRTYPTRLRWRNLHEGTLCPEGRHARSGRNAKDRVCASPRMGPPPSTLTLEIRSSSRHSERRDRSRSSRWRRP